MSTDTLELPSVVEAPACEVWNVSAEEYHADSANSVSRSELKDFGYSPALYFGRHVLGEYPREESPALDFGSALHGLALEGDSGVVVIPEHVLSKNGARSGQAWKDFEAEHDGKILMKSHEFAPVEKMLAAIQRHALAANLIFGRPGQNEIGLRWYCKDTGIRRRARLDRLLDDGAIVDLKSTNDCRPAEFVKSIVKFGYHAQAAYYCDAIEAMTGERIPFVFVAVEKTAPYGCECFELDEEFLEMGRAENLRLLERLAECRKSGVWETSTHGQIVTVSPPNWLRFKDQYEMVGEIA